MLLVAIGIATVASAQVPTFSKMSPLVRQAVMDASMIQRRATGSKDGRRMMAFVRIDKDIADSLLTYHRCRKLAQWGDIVIADIPLSSLRTLSAEPQVLRIEAGRQATAQMDTTLSIVNALPSYETTAGHAAYRGEGVVVGLMDIGFDLTHPNFRDAETAACRISAFWDQLSTDTVGSLLPVGRDYVGPAEVLSKGRSTDGDTQWHGTHTLGSAAGMGAATPWSGMAPGSDICLVSNAVTEDTVYIAPDDRYKYTTATDALGFKYIFDYAQQQGKPCVASFSEGSTPYMDAEDSLYATVLDSLTGPGRIIVASAGNQGLAKTYFEKPANVKEAGAFIHSYRHDTFYSIMTEGPVRVCLYGYCGEAGIPTDTFFVDVPNMLPDSILTNTMTLSSGDTLQVLLYLEHSRFTQHDICQIYITAARNIAELPPLALVTSGDGSAEVYGTTSWAFTEQAIDTRWQAISARNVMTPGCFSAVLCVGATTHRQHVCNAEGKELLPIAGSQSGQIGIFSSTGPAMNGLMKPDVVAPGELVVSSMSHYSQTANYVVTYTNDADGTPYPWGASSGTSMSTPVVAGAIALWLQACPTLTTDEVRQVLNRTCRHPEPQLTYPNNTYGHGEIDVYRGLLDILGVTAIRDVSLHHPEGVHISKEAGGLHLTFARADRESISVDIYDLGGICQYTVNTPSVANSELFVPLPPLAAGIYVVQVNGKNVKGSQLVRL